MSPDYHRDSISDYPNEYKDNHNEDYQNVGHQNPHSSGINFLDIFFWFLCHFISYFSFSFFTLKTVDVDNMVPRVLTEEIMSAIQSVRFIAQHIKDADKDNEVSRLFYLIVFC